jgi:hypothetical protein
LPQPASWGVGHCNPRLQPKIASCPLQPFIASNLDVRNRSRAVHRRTTPDCLKRADCGPTGVASGRTGVWAKAVPSLLARIGLVRLSTHSSQPSQEQRSERLRTEILHSPKGRAPLRLGGPISGFFEHIEGNITELEKTPRLEDGSHWWKPSIYDSQLDAGGECP